MDNTDHQQAEDSAAGWDAIDAALARLYPDGAPFHLGTEHPWALGGPDPLDGISVHPRTDPLPHWHVVGYGMSELYDKESDNPEQSGWGFEFTMRVLRRPDETQPPMWPCVLLQTLGRYVFSSGNRFEPGHRMAGSGPLDPEREGSVIEAFTFVEDPELGTVDTPHGSLRFLQVVGITRDELKAAQDTSSAALLDLMAQRLPLHVTDVDRPSFLSDPAFARALGL